MKKWIVVLIFFFFAVVFSYKPLFADGEQFSGINQKLSQILDNQAEILKQLSDVKSELQVIKVRASAK